MGDNIGPNQYFKIRVTEDFFYFTIDYLEFSVNIDNDGMIDVKDIYLTTTIRLVTRVVITIRLVTFRRTQGNEFM